MDEEKIIYFKINRERRLAALRQAALQASESDEEKKRNRVHSKDFFLMILVAGMFDVVQFFLSLIPFIGWFLSAALGGAAWYTFYRWTSNKGWGLADTGKQKALMKALIKFFPAVEIIPLANALPLWTVRVLLQISLLKAEDTLYNVTGGRADFEKIEELYKKVS